MRRTFLVSVAALAFAGACSSAPPPATPAPVTLAPTASAAETAPDVKPVRVDLFVMAKCAYCAPVEATFVDIRNKLGRAMDLHVDYVGSVDASHKISSMHGADELQGDLFQICAQAHSPKWLEAVVCQNKDPERVGESWPACAKEVGVDDASIAAVTTCARGDEGKSLLLASFERAMDKNAHGAPTVLIEGAQYDGARGSRRYRHEICKHFGDAPPASCSIEPAPPVDVLLLGDARGGDAASSKHWEEFIKGHIDNPHIQHVDVLDPTGRDIYAHIKGTTLPAIVIPTASFDGDSDAEQDLMQKVVSVGKFKIVSKGEWNPACADDGGCKLDACKHVAYCRAEEPKKLDVYMMSRDPFQKKGFEALAGVLDDFAKKKSAIDVRIHFVGENEASGLHSMHGPDEIADDLREACVQKIAKAKVVDFIRCRNADWTVDWKTCTGGKTGLDAAKIDKCATGDEGKKLLEASFQDAHEIGTRASPTYFVNGKFRVDGSTTAEKYKAMLCDHNGKLAACAP